jgi:acyl transferase domain-containing protein/NAD(P)-dependent dehydrogenase (short-subunit alcohol dehydrogenase family)/acyl carrier protein
MSSQQSAAVLQLAYEKIQAQRLEIHRLEAARREPIAVVGYACRFPGGVTDPEALWRALNRVHDVISQVGEDRWATAEHHSGKARVSGKMYTLAAGLVDDIDRFDAAFFGIPAVEAAGLDPQQRMLLETSWHALEHAGLDPKALARSRTGVFVGVTTDDYARLHARSPLKVSTYTGLGSAKSMAAGRLAYFYDFRGPVLQLDTTCSSTLVAAHLAMRELGDGSCDLALIGGANAIVSPDTMVGFCEMNALSPTGRLHAFDDRANGYVRGEGCGILVLQRYSDALAAGRTVHAVLRGSAMSHDGRTNGLTAPNPEAQEDVIRRALAAASCVPEDVQYVEAHGTGTRLGDLIEAKALGAAYGGRTRPLRIGSVKANIGHLEAAAGSASLIKAIECLKRGVVPGQVNFSEPNRRVDWARLGLDVSASEWRWPAEAKPRRAGVSAFGMSGTNIHLIVEAGPEAPAQPPRATLPLPPLLLVSARDRIALRARLKQYSGAFSQLPPEQRLALVARSQLGGHFSEFRVALSPSDTLSIEGALAATQDRQPASPEAGLGGLAFVFGSHLPLGAHGAAALCSQAPRFASSLSAAAAVLREETGEDWLALYLAGTASGARGADARLSVVVALHLALLEVWAGLGVAPGAVLGHGAGLYVAAVAAGTLTPAEALRLACRHERRRSGSPGVDAGERDLLASLQPNDPERYWALADGTTCDRASAVSALASPEGWTTSLAQAAGGLGNLLARGYRRFFSLGSDSGWPQLVENARQGARFAVVDWPFASDEPWTDAGRTLAALYEMGVDIDWQALWEPGAQLLEAPPYPFNRLRHWLPLEQVTGRRRDAATGFAVEWLEAATGARRARVAVNDVAQPHLAQHSILGTIIVAAASWIVLLLVAARELLGPRSPVSIRNLRFLRPLLIASGSALDVELSFTRKDNGTWEVVASTRSGSSSPVTHCTALLGTPPLPPDDHVLRHWQGDASAKVSAGDAFYEKFTSRGYDLGPAFRWVTGGEDGSVTARRELTRPAALPADDGRYPLFPGLVDSCFHALAGLLRDDVALEDGSEVVIPALVESICFLPEVAAGAASDAYQVYASRSKADGLRLPPLAGSLVLVGADQQPLLLIDRVEFRKISKSRLEPSSSAESTVHRLLASWSELSDLSALAGKGEGREPPIVIVDSDPSRAALGAMLPEGATLLIASSRSRPATAAELDALVSGVERAGVDRRDVLVVLSALAESALEGQPIDRGVAAQCAFCAALVTRLHRLRRADGRAVRVFLRKGQRTTPGVGALSLAAIAGMLLSAGAERMPVCVVEAQASQDEPEVLERLYRGELSAAPAGEYLWDHGWKERVFQDASERRPRAPVGSNLSGGVAIVTGGTGGLAPYLTAWLLERGAERVLQLGRTCVDGALHPEFDGRVIYRRCDVANEAEVRALFASVHETLPVVAVVHAAGALSDKLIGELGIADFYSTLAPKLGGAVNLARCWRSDELRLVVGVSSLTSVTGSVAQGAYSAANRALDRWVLSLRAQNIPAFTLNLGPVAAGMADRLSNAHKQRLERFGLSLLAPMHLGSILSDLVTRDGQMVAYAGSKSVSGGNYRDGDVAPGPSQSPEGILPALSAKMRELLGEGKHTSSSLEHASLAELGADSLLAAELSLWVEQTYSIDFTMDQVMAEATLAAIAERVAQKMGEAGGAIAAADADGTWVEGEL